MAKETRAQREERLDAERQEQLLARAETFPARLMNLLERATNMNFALTVKNAEFRVEDRDDGSVTFLPLEFTDRADCLLDDLEWAVQKKETAEAEAERRLLLRTTALSKLSKEEREALGL